MEKIKLADFDVWDLEPGFPESLLRLSASTFAGDTFVLLLCFWASVLNSYIPALFVYVFPRKIFIKGKKQQTGA